MDPVFNFAANFRALRAIYGMSIKDVAKDLKVSPSTVVSWEHGRSAPQPQHIMDIAEYFGVTVMTLVDLNALIKPLYKAK